MKLQYLRNKTQFSHLGTMFHVENNAVKLSHWPFCGMNAKTCRLLAKWLLKRADEIEQKGRADE